MKKFVYKAKKAYSIIPVSHQGTPIQGKAIAFADRKDAIDEIIYRRAFGEVYKLATV
jgi:hypothetical protein